jgi:uncharacterized membrane protein YoaK (UPF0700 family)
LFSHEGPTRSVRKNGALAGYLAFVAGFVNSAGFVLVGYFTSHVTGSIGRVGVELGGGDIAAGLSTALLVLTFFVGAFTASLVLETSLFGRTSAAYGVALLLESTLLGTFMLLVPASYLTMAGLVLLSCAMGMQNSLVTRLSGAVVRTTHLTGVVTDLGIEAARWYRWHRAKLRALPALLPPRSPAERPVVARTVVLATILVAFTAGAVAGVSATHRFGRLALLLPTGAVLAASLYAFVSRGPASGDAPASTATERRAVGH